MRLLLCALGACLLVACGPPKTVLLRFGGAPGDALVTVNERYIGPLSRLQRRGLRLPPGTYRVTVEQVGYFPEDRIVVVPEEAIPPVMVELTPVPD